MNPELEETIYVDFITSSPTTGAAIDADSLPACEVFEDATDTPIISPTVVKRTGKTGDYRIPIVCTSANGFEAGKSYNAVVSATVGAVAAKAVVKSFQMRVNGPDDIAGYLDTEVAAIKSQTDKLTFTGTDVKATLDGEQVTLTIAALSDIADAILKRDFSALSGEAAYSLANAVRALRNKWNTTGGTLTIFKEDGSTTAWTSTLTTTAGANPITGGS